MKGPIEMLVAAGEWKGDATWIVGTITAGTVILFWACVWIGSQNDN